MNTFTTICWAITILCIIGALIAAPMMVLGLVGIYLLLCWFLEPPRS